MAKLPVVDFHKYHHLLSSVSTYSIRGKVTELTGLVVRAVVPGVRMGELCFIVPYHSRTPIKAEVVGFRDQEVLLMPLGNLEGIGLGNDVIPSGHTLTVRVGPQLLGRVLDGLGDPLDEEDQGPLHFDTEYPVTADPPAALKRERVTKPISVGIKAIDAMLTVGEGQRIGFFAAAGVGKSTLIGMIARNTEAEVNVICLVGERGREVRDFIERDLGPEGLKRSVLIVSTSDQPSLVRLKAAYVATAIAEYFRDNGKKVMLMMDSITRFARALREVGLAVGEPPARQGYTYAVGVLHAAAAARAFGQLGQGIDNRVLHDPGRRRRHERAGRRRDAVDSRRTYRPLARARGAEPLSGDRRFGEHQPCDGLHHRRGPSRRCREPARGRCKL